jgi:hypothetical protein
MFEGVHRLCNGIANLPKRPAPHEEIKAAHWAVLKEATDPQEAEHGLRQLVTE